MKKYEVESLLKSFLLFFLLQLLVLLVFISKEYREEEQQFYEDISTQMTLCSYDLKCNNFELTFVSPPNNIVIEKLYKENQLYSYFSVPTDDGYLMKVVLSQESYENKKLDIYTKIFFSFAWYLLPIIVISMLFALYSLRPLKKALELNDEFIRDILHDFNTPLASMVINLKLMRRELGENKKIIRIENNIETMLSLEKNLQTFLHESALNKEVFSVGKTVEERVSYFKVLYSDINFTIQDIDLLVEVNKDAFIRILDNIIQNSTKYSRNEGTVTILFQKDSLIIQDNGRGIKNVFKVFERYYKESDRGLGIGLHIVKKLCDELDIIIKIESELGKGTTVWLDLSTIVQR